MFSSQGPPASSDSRVPRSDAVAPDYREHTESRGTSSRTLQPATLPHLRTLVLSNFPAKSFDHGPVQQLIDFIRLCAVEANRAHTHAKFDWSLPPGRAGQASALQTSADKVFALKRIVLEVAPIPKVFHQKSHAASWKQTSTMKSMTGDRDVEALWSAAESDFSFFDGQVDGAQSSSGVESWDSGRAVNSIIDNLVDNIAVLSGFRRERKLAHERNLAAGSQDAFTEGYWDGVIEVVRAGSDNSRGE